jgi:hypothetical protein
MKQIVRNATHVANVGNAKRAMNPSDTAITKIDDAIPRAGCFMAGFTPLRKARRPRQ